MANQRRRAVQKSASGVESDRDAQLASCFFQRARDRACTKESQGRISVSCCSRGAPRLALSHFPRVSHVGRIWTPRAEEGRALTRNPAVGSNELLRTALRAFRYSRREYSPFISLDSACTEPRELYLAGRYFGTPRGPITIF